MKHVCRKRSICRRRAATTSGAQCPAFRQPMPPAKSMKRLPSTSSIAAPSARSTNTGVTCETPLATAAVRRRSHSWERGPGIEVRKRIVDILLLLDGCSFRSCRPAGLAVNNHASTMHHKTPGSRDRNMLSLASRVIPEQESRQAQKQGAADEHFQLENPDRSDLV